MLLILRSSFIFLLDQHSNRYAREFRELYDKLLPDCWQVTTASFKQPGLKKRKYFLTGHKNAWLHRAWDMQWRFAAISMRFAAISMRTYLFVPTVVMGSRLQAYHAKHYIFNTIYRLPQVRWLQAVRVIIRMSLNPDCTELVIKQLALWASRGLTKALCRVRRHRCKFTMSCP